MADRALPRSGTAAGEVVVPCDELAPALAHYVDELGFRLDAIFPADDPRVASISRGDERLRLERVAAAPPVAAPPVAAGPLVTRAAGGRWIVGRAGMGYRDLVPGRLGGALIASHIRIDAGGPVPDQVHFHVVDVQLIFCRRGWVRVVYEDQGPPFVLEPGDCVLQAPTIRHRVLESSPGLEVVELSAPAEHETRIDHDLALPTGQVAPDRRFGGQRFVRHVARGAAWRPARPAGFDGRDLGLAEASGGRVDARVVRPAVAASTPGRPEAPSAATTFGFVLAGAVTLACHGHPPARLDASDAYTLPPGIAHDLRDATPDLELLVVDVAG